jgi:hypothetical protein
VESKRLSGVKLTDLEPQFLKITSPTTYHHVETIAEADGIMFLCPKCFATHSILCWRPRVDASHRPGPGRWEFEGASYNDLTLVAGSSSVFLTGDGCKAHFFVRNGEIIGC